VSLNESRSVVSWGRPDPSGAASQIGWNYFGPADTFGVVRVYAGGSSVLTAQADLRDLFRNGNGVADGPIRTVALDEVTTRRAQEPQAAAPAAERPAIRGATEAPITRQPIEEAPSPVQASARANPAPAAVQARFADCTFVCMPEGVPAAKYPVTRSYQLGDGRTLNDVTLDAFADHAGFCLDSGGLAHAGSVPICEQQ